MITDLARPFDDTLLVRRKRAFFARLLDDHRHTILLLSDLEPRRAGRRRARRRDRG